MIYEKQRNEVVDRMINVYLELGDGILNNRYDSGDLDAFVKLSALVVSIVTATL